MAGLKVCKDGRIWGQNNKEASDHLGVLVTKGRQEYFREYRRQHPQPSQPYIKKGYPETHYWRTNGEFKKGYIDSDKTKTKKSLSHLGELNSQYGKKGEGSAGWKGGISPLIDAIRTLSEYKQWRSDVYKRDYWTCQTCDKKGGGIRIHAHHIKSLAQILKDRNIKSLIEAQLCEEIWDINNGVTLCYECHKLTDNYGHTIKESEVN